MNCFTGDYIVDAVFPNLIFLFFVLQLSPAYSGAPAASPGYGEGRAGWPGPPVSGQHGPSSPGPPSATTIASQPSPQPTQQPSHSPGPGLPPSPQHPTTQPQHQVSQGWGSELLFGNDFVLAEFSKSTRPTNNSQCTCTG